MVYFDTVDLVMIPNQRGGVTLMISFPRRLFIPICLIILCTMAFSEQLALPNIKLPMVVTTCGQSPGALKFRLICQRSTIQCDQQDLLTAEVLRKKAASGEGYKTLVITTGTSLKGMGAAGVDINSEIKRIKEIMEEARKQGILIIGAHIEGMARRVDETDAKSIETVIPNCDLILVIQESNSDGFFTKISQEKQIPILEVKDVFDIGPAIKALIQQ